MIKVKTKKLTKKKELVAEKKLMSNYGARPDFLAARHQQDKGIRIKAAGHFVPARCLEG